MKNSTGYIIISLAGFIFLFLLYLYIPRTPNPYKILFLSIFILICLLGMVASIYPSHCLRFFKIETVTLYECKNNVIQNDGHHPDCGEFSKHVFAFKNKKFCVGCTGLFTGSFLAILTCLLYVKYGAPELIFWMGIIIVLVSLLQLIFLNLENKWIKFLSNLGLVWGSSLILLGILEYSNALLSLYFLLLIGALIMTRTIISERNHELICINCTK